MIDKTETILNAATVMFARYGYAKTTIGDIVTEAGVARQTVYNSFSSKEEILRAVVQRSGDQMHNAVINAWNKDTPRVNAGTKFAAVGVVNKAIPSRIAQSTSP